MPGKLKTLWQLMRGHRLHYGAGILAMCVSIVLMYLPPLVVRAVIDGLLRGDRSNADTRLILRLLGASSMARSLLLAGTAVVALGAISALFSYLKGRLAATATERITRSLRQKLYDHLQHLPCSYHDKAQTGDLVQRCTSDVETLRTFYGSQVIDISRAWILFLFVLPMLLRQDMKTAVAAVCLLPFIVAFSLIFFSRVRSAFKSMDEAEGHLTTVLQENLTGIRVVRAFARQQFETEKFAAKNRTYRDRHWRMFRIMALYWSCSDLMCFAQMAIILLYGAHRVIHGGVSVGTLVAFLSYSGMYIWPVRYMGRILTELGKAMVSLGRVQEILGQKRESDCELRIADCELEGPPKSCRGEIELRGVSFSHGSQPVLHDITLHVPAGRSLAILGPSGSGKSTVINLLLRLYDYEQGSIRLDGREIREMDRKAVRRHFGVVMQEPFLYSKTLRDNIKLGRHDAPDEHMIEIAQMAQIHESIEEFDGRYDTLVGERGVTLSGGQRQRVAIARALLQDAPILILDDALSAVDTQTETMILDALKRRRGRATTLIIAHRLSTLMHADQIIVLEHGRIVQRGSHEQLVAEEGLYQRLWQVQGALEEDLRIELESGDGQSNGSGGQECPPLAIG